MREVWKKVIHWIYTHNTKRYIIITITFALLGIILTFSQFFGTISLADDKALDMLFYYNKTTFYEILHQLTASERIAYKFIHIGDYLFIVGAYPLLSIGLSKMISIEKKERLFIVIPILAGLFDLFENIAMDIHLYFFPREIVFLGEISGIFSASKYTLLYLSVGLIILIPLFKFFKKRFS